MSCLIAGVLAFWFFFGSVNSFIEAKKVQGGAYISYDIGDVWTDKAQLKRHNICTGLGMFFLGCGAVWYCWLCVKPEDKQYSARGLEDE